MKEKNTALGIIVIAFIVITFGIVTIQTSASNIKVTSYKNVSDSETFLSESSGSVSELGEGLVSQDIYLYNSTYLQFDGVNDVIDYSNVGPLNLHNESYSICMWANVINRITLGESSNNDYLKLFPSGLLTMEDSTDTVINLDMGNGYEDGEWEHICLSFDNTTDNITLYVNGLRNANNQIVNTLTSNFNTKYIGQAKATEWLNGSIDDFYIFDSAISGESQAYSIMESSSRFYGNQYVPILMSHQVRDDINTSLMINTTELTMYLDFFNETGTECISIDEYYNWTQGLGTIPERSVVWIFDDAHISVINNAFPIMQTYGCQGVIAIPTRDVGTGTTMTWDNLSTMKDAGWTFASHWINNTHVTATPQDLWDDYFSESKNSIIGNLSYTPVGFVYPGNDFNDTTNAVCDDYYSMCFGKQVDINDAYVYYATKNTNLVNGDLWRIDTINDSEIEYLEDKLNFTINDYLLRYTMNENNGSTSNDISGNNIDGNISGPIWISSNYYYELIEDIDYDMQSNGTFTILNDNYLWSEYNVSYVYSEEVLSDSDVIATLIPLFVAIVIIVFLVILSKYLIDSYGLGDMF